MNFIQTLYIANSKHPFKDSFGWAAPEYHLMGWALSCLQLNKLYGSVELYANSNAAKLLIDTLELPYSKLHLTHDNLNLINDNLWALPKIFTYSLQSEPFVHLDGDVFIFKQLPDTLLQNDLIAQNVETATDYYLSTQKELLQNFTFFPACVKAEFDLPTPINAVNAGILGGNNIAFIKEYTDIAFEYINKNAAKLSTVNVDLFNVFFEQHLFYALAKEKSISIGCLFEEIIEDNQYKHLSEFYEAPYSKSYFHLLGHYKRDKYTCLQMTAKLRELYPEYYYRIISLCKKQGISLSISLYNNSHFNELSDYQSFNRLSKKEFNDAIVFDCFGSTEKADSLHKRIVFDLSMLQRVGKMYKEKLAEPGEKEKLTNDFAKLAESLSACSNSSQKFSATYLYGRDLAATKWFCELFGNAEEMGIKFIVRCTAISVIESEFDWAGLLNKHELESAPYYKDLALSQGAFYNLVIPEVSGYGFSLIDIDEFENTILNLLIVPCTIETLLHKMSVYVAEEVLREHLDQYNHLVITMIKQLVAKKAIKPFNQTTE